MCLMEAQRGGAFVQLLLAVSMFSTSKSAQAGAETCHLKFLCCCLVASIMADTFCPAEYIRPESMY